MPLDISVNLVVGSPLIVEVSDGQISGIAKGPDIEPARTKDVTVEEVVEHVGRMGDSPFEPRSWDVELQPGAGVGFSLLHRIRREALADFEKNRLAAWSKRKLRRPKG